MTAACPGQCHALLVSAVTRGLLPLAGAPPDDPARRALEFYAHGYLKERVAFRLVAGLGVRSPCALSRIHAAVLSGRDAAGAALLAGVLPAGDAPGRVLVAAAAECHLRVLACGLGRCCGRSRLRCLRCCSLRAPRNWRGRRRSAGPTGTRSKQRHKRSLRTVRSSWRLPSPRRSGRGGRTPS